MSSYENESCTELPFWIGTIISLCACGELRLPAEMGTILACLGMPDPRLMWAEEVQSKQQQFEAAEGCFNADIRLAFLRRAVDYERLVAVAPRSRQQAGDARRLGARQAAQSREQLLVERI